jgi:hypothetical protein
MVIFSNKTLPIYIEEDEHREHQRYLLDTPKELRLFEPNQISRHRKSIKPDYDKSCEIVVETVNENDNDEKNFSLYSIWFSIKDLTKEEWIDVERCNKNINEHYEILRKQCWYNFRL